MYVAYGITAMYQKHFFIERGQSLQNGSYAKNLERNIIAMLSF